MENKPYWDEHPSYAESVMRYLDGEEIVAHLSWDEKLYYLWFEPTCAFEDFCEEIGREDMLTDLLIELEKIGVRKFGSLDSVNSFCESKCGDDEPAQFIYDDYYETVEGV